MDKLEIATALYTTPSRLMFASSITSLLHSVCPTAKALGYIEWCLVYNPLEWDDWQKTVSGYPVIDATRATKSVQ